MNGFIAKHGPKKKKTSGTQGKEKLGSGQEEKGQKRTSRLNKK